MIPLPDYNTGVVLLGAGLLGASCGLVGTFAVLRRRSLTGDALAHAALPGLGVAFLLAQERSLPVLLTGALLSGLVGIGVIAALRQWTRVKEDAAIGIVLSVFFGAGIVLSKLITRLPGGSEVSLESYILGKTAGMLLRDVYLIGGVALTSLLTVLLLYKELKLVSFDREFARVEGWPTFGLDLLLMALIAVTVVIGLPAVGVVLVTALLILPAAAARFWTDRLGVMLVLAALFGTVIGVAGTLLSARYSLLPTGPIIVLVGTAVFLASVLLAPRRGGLARWLIQWRFRRKLAEQTLLRVLFDLTEPHLPERRPASVADITRLKSFPPATLQRLLARAGARGLAEAAGPGSWRLTEAGLARATAVAHSHRLWKLFLVEYADTAGSVADLDAESLTQHVTPDVLAELRAKLRQSGRWSRAEPEVVS
jgi:manganese/zinc/iron transport system permease protein